MSVELKIKSCTLAAEARIIRKHERAALRSARWLKERQHNSDSDEAYKHYRSLNGHRRNTVRREARRTHLARAFIAGMPYKQVESSTRPDKQLSDYDLIQIATMVRRYSEAPEMNKDLVEVWVTT